MEAERSAERLWWAVGAIALVALGLRIAAAQGGLWTDEAWSMIYAEQARDPLGVFLRINHDNNHHLISLWLQAIGVHASPLLARAPAIVAGTLAVPVAALLFARRSGPAAIASAALFAVSPIMVTYGSEARGYAPMMLAALVMILLATNKLEGRGSRATPWWIALTVLLGMLSNLTMLAPVALLTVWVYLERRSSAGTAGAIRATAALMGPALGACAAVLLLVFSAAFVSPTGLQVGGYVPFTLRLYSVALSHLMAWTVGLSFGRSGWPAVVVLFGIGLAILVRPPAWMGSRARLYAILILGVPIAIIVERTGNSSFARYYLCSAIGLLLLGAEWIGHAVERRGAQRVLGVTACALFLAMAGWRDGQVIELKRGEPDRALRIIAEEAPSGARVAIGTERLFAPIMAAAQRVDYPLAEAKGCAPAQFMIAARDASSKPAVMRCGRRMQVIAWSETSALSGDPWVLYRLGSLQTAGPPVSGPAPRRAESSPPPRRAGVAQG